MSEKTSNPTFTLEERINIVETKVLTHTWKSLVEIRDEMIEKDKRFLTLFEYKGAMFNEVSRFLGYSKN
jgi:hypothetical protein